LYRCDHVLWRGGAVTHARTVDLDVGSGLVARCADVKTLAVLGGISRDIRYYRGCVVESWGHAAEAAAPSAVQGHVHPVDGDGGCGDARIVRADYGQAQGLAGFHAGRRDV